MLTRPEDRDHVEQIFRAGLAAVEGGAAVGQCLSQNTFPMPKTASNRIFILGAGKAAAAMAKAAEDFFLRQFPEKFGDGLIVVKEGHKALLKRTRILEASHPVPDERGLNAAREVKRFLHVLQRGDVLYFLLSGGASALLPAPAEGVTLADKQKLTKILLDCGANIHEINTLRKHCSFLKGGRMIRLAKGANVVTLAISDVPGDEPESIGSGPTVPDPTTLADCEHILERYQIKNKIPHTIVKHLQGKDAETPKPDDPVFANAQFKMVANNQKAVESAAKRARDLGYEVIEAPEFFRDDIKQVESKWLELKKAQDQKTKSDYVIICGGEPTVEVKGKGKGGRNQELALRLALSMQGNFSFFAAGTDGSDGPTDAAGAFCDETTCTRAQPGEPKRALTNQDSYPFFDGLGDLLRTGPTATNVMDLHILLVRK